MKESHVLTRIRNALNRTANVRLFRNNCGCLRDADGRYIHYGIPGPGGSDLVGWTSVIVTPEMVGSRVAILTCIEVKNERGKLGVKQETWLDAVAAAGGRAGVARSVEDAEAICGL